MRARQNECVLLLISELCLTKTFMVQSRKKSYSSNLKKNVEFKFKSLQTLPEAQSSLWGGEEGSIVTKYLVFILCKISTDRILFVLFCFFCLLLGGLVSFVFVSK